MSFTATTTALVLARHAEEERIEALAIAKRKDFIHVKTQEEENKEVKEEHPESSVKRVLLEDDICR